MIYSTQTKVTVSLKLIIASLIFALAGWLAYPNLFFLVILTFGLYALSEPHYKQPLLQTIVWIITFVVGFMAATYRPESFSNPLIWSTEQLYSGGEEFNLYANLAKGLCGYLIVIWLLDKVNRTGQLKSVPSIALALLSALILMAIGVVFFGLETHFKLPKETVYFIAVNLGITVLAEEAYFRLLLQAQIERIFKNIKVGRTVAVAIAAPVFAFAHTGQLNQAFLLFLIAGLIYAMVFALTRRFSAAVLCHFAVNILHFIFFEYPLTF